MQAEIVKRLSYKKLDTTYHEQTINKISVFDSYNDLVDIKTVKLRDGATRLENAMFFLEQIKNPLMFRVGDDVVELCFAGDESLSNVLAKHFNRKK